MDVMKTYAKLLMILFVVTVFLGSGLRAETKKKPLLGEWLYEVSDAPYGYEKGSLIFAEKNGNTTCVVKLEAGELQVDDLKIENNKISFSTTVEGNVVHVNLVHENNKITGTVDSPEGPKTISAVKKS
jgi:hypothetical protein